MGNRLSASHWYSIENKADEPDTSQVFLYNEIGSFGTTAAEFVGDLRNIKTPKIELRISSPGGEVFDGMAIYNAIRNHPAKVTVHIDGLAASAASFIAMAGDYIKAERNATLMIHDGMGIAAGNSKDMRDLAALLDKCSDNIASIYAEKAGGSVEQWRDRMRDETWYTATEAQRAGLVDEVLTGKARITNSLEWDLSLFRYAGRDKAPDPLLNHTQPEPEPPEEPAPDNPPDEAGFFMPDIRGPIQALGEIPFDPDLFRAAVTVVAHDAPAVPDNAPPAPLPAEPSYTVPDLRRAIREARL